MPAVVWLNTTMHAQSGKVLSNSFNVCSFSASKQKVTSPDNMRVRDRLCHQGMTAEHDEAILYDSE